MHRGADAGKYWEKIEASKAGGEFKEMGWDLLF